MKLHERIRYEPTPERKPLALPDGARVVVWTVVTVEVWDPSGPLPRQVLSAPGGQRLASSYKNGLSARALRGNAFMGSGRLFQREAV